jgi:hypothetical protein
MTLVQYLFVCFFLLTDSLFFVSFQVEAADESLVQERLGVQLRTVVVPHCPEFVDEAWALMLKGDDGWAVAFSGESRAWQAVLHNYQRIR